MQSSCDRFVTLRGGLVVPLDAFNLALDLERRGARIELADGDRLWVRPRSVLTDADREAIRRWRHHFRAIVSYQVPNDVP